MKRFNVNSSASRPTSLVKSHDQTNLIEGLQF
jgi:hypothetical protein